MLEELRSLKRDTRTLRNFGIFLSVLFFIIAVYLIWTEPDKIIRFSIISVMGILGILFSFWYAKIYKPLYLGWMTMAVIIGWIMTRFILTILFIILITPIGLIKSLIGKKVIQLRADDSNRSYWQLRSHSNQQREYYEKQY